MSAEELEGALAEEDLPLTSESFNKRRDQDREARLKVLSTIQPITATNDPLILLSSCCFVGLLLTCPLFPLVPPPMLLLVPLLPPVLPLLLLPSVS